jgi:hypothetical protein
MNYEMSCDCGMKIPVEAASRDEAIQKVKGIMTEDAIKEHMASDHVGQPVPTVEQAHAMIEQYLTQIS